MKKRQFTGEELAKALLLNLTLQELNEHFQKQDRRRWRVHDHGFFATLWRRIIPSKIFFIRFTDDHGVILMAKNEEDACIQAVPFLNEHAHHCKNPLYNESCSDCRAVFDKTADRLNHSTVTWLGWSSPDYNSVIHT